MKLTYLILLTLAIFACLASVAEAGKKGDRRLGKRAKKAGKRNALGKGKKKGGRKGGRRNKFNKDDDDDEEETKTKRKAKKGRGKGKGKKTRKGGKKTKKGSKNFSKGKKGGKKEGKKTRKGGKTTRKGGDEKKGPKMCKRYEIKELPGNVVVEYQSNFPDGFVEVVKAAADFGYTGGCEAWYCVSKNWEIVQYPCTTCTQGQYIYDVGQCLPVNDYVKRQCMVNPADPKLPGVWKTIGARDFPMSLTQIMKYSDNPDMCYG